MASILFTWQLGAGMGHLFQMLPLVEGLSRANRLWIAARRLPRVVAVPGFGGVGVLQAPAKNEGRLFFPSAVNFAQLLGNLGFGDDHELFALACAWRNLFRLVRPDLIIFDHSPIALLAARGLPARRALIGSGFCCPPDVFPLPAMRSLRNLEVNWDQVAADEQAILRRVNGLLDHWRQPPLDRLGRLYGDVDECSLTTFPELDHYPGRGPARYWGPVNGSGGAAPRWPEGAGKRVFAYLKPWPGLPALLDVLRDRRLPTLVLSDGISANIRRRYESPTLRFETRRLDPSAVARECDLTVLNATHGTTCDVLLAGKPVLQVPLYGEQQLMAEAVRRLGAGVVVWPARDQRPAFEQALDQLLNDDRYARAARRFAARHADFDPELQREAMVARACDLLPSPSRRTLEFLPAPAIPLESP